MYIYIYIFVDVCINIFVFIRSIKRMYSTSSVIYIYIYIYTLHKTYVQYFVRNEETGEFIQAQPSPSALNNKQAFEELESKLREVTNERDRLMRDGGCVHDDSYLQLESVKEEVSKLHLCHVHILFVVYIYVYMYIYIYLLTLGEIIYICTL